MEHAFQRIAHGLSSTFGRCGRCLRTAGRAALLAWAVVIVAAGAHASAAILVAAALAAVALSIVAGLHIVYFAARLVAPVRAGRAVPAGAGPDFAIGRRRVLRLFLAGCAGAAMAVLGLPRGARASCGDCAAQFGSGYHDCITYSCNTQGQVCCPPGHPYLNHCDCQCYDTTDFNCSSYSNCLYCG